MIYSYWWNEAPNFGDMITPYLVKKISGIVPIQTNNSPDGQLLFAAGSILQLSNSQSIVWGSGFIEEQKTLIQVKKIHAVRGPLTKKNLDGLKIPCPEVYGDPGILLPRYYLPNVVKKFKVGIIPHYVDKNCEALTLDKDWLVIDIQRPVEEVISLILSCDKILSSSLHGLIVADAYGVPTRWMKFSNKIYGNDFKFKDYYASIGFELSPAFDIEVGIKQARLHNITLADNLLKAYPNEFRN